jgi:hypothetical protein
LPKACITSLLRSWPQVLQKKDHDVDCRWKAYLANADHFSHIPPKNVPQPCNTYIHICTPLNICMCIYNIIYIYIIYNILYIYILYTYAFLKPICHAHFATSVPTRPKEPNISRKSHGIAGCTGTPFASFEATWDRSCLKERGNKSQRLGCRIFIFHSHPKTTSVLHLP